MRPAPPIPTRCHCDSRLAAASARKKAKIATDRYPVVPQGPARRSSSTQACPKQPILVEDLAASLRWADDAIAEPEFCNRLARRTGRCLPQDLNSLVVNALNDGTDAVAAALDVACAGFAFDRWLPQALRQGWLHAVESRPVAHA